MYVCMHVCICACITSNSFGTAGEHPKWGVLFFFATPVRGVWCFVALWLPVRRTPLPKESRQGPVGQARPWSKVRSKQAGGVLRATKCTTSFADLLKQNTTTTLLSDDAHAGVRVGRV